ncbi:MAG: hypothetical protein HY738_14620 [Bacteroidia bacterium]|nr:hypothetical protein [Bacteroidia bacterium]
MKAQIISFAMLLVAMVTTAQDCFWAKKGGGFYDDYGKGVVANPNGNIYITGYFGSSSLNFGDTVLYNQSIPGYTYSDIFLTKYDIAGNLIWAKDFGSALNEVSRAIAIDETDNFYITGFFTSDSLVCGSVVLYNDNSDPDPDFFVAKLDSNGNAI